MAMICPNCEKKTDIKSINQSISIDVRGEDIEVVEKFYQCLECGESFESTQDYDVLDAAYREYRKRHNMIQPEKLRNWRKSMGLTQKELSDMIGWGGATISRYENGALQIESHEKILHLVMEPRNLCRLVEESPEALSDKKYNRLIKELKAVEDESCSFEMVFQDKLGNYEPDEFSGFSRFSLTKIFNAILYLSKDGILKTKLNKLLFYADFKHFKEYSNSITGVRYVHLPYGPVPDNYGYYSEKLVNENLLVTEEVFFGDYSGIKYVSNVSADFSVFSDSEIKVLAMVKEYFEDFSSSRIKDFSHDEKAYRETSDNQKISYAHASDLKI
ncbi:MAG: DUF4065 domain-containing protein [Gammaproteobacteria bacterium]|nr:DUF4065 domain-containing protein [Gammaproteobacteria bacterium]